VFRKGGLRESLSGQLPKPFHYPKKVVDFLNAANFADAGYSALIDVCAVSLGERVVQFLGNGEWSSRSDYAEIDA
jgi:hypothetical protein